MVKGRVIFIKKLKVPISRKIEITINKYNNKQKIITTKATSNDPFNSGCIRL